MSGEECVRRKIVFDVTGGAGEALAASTVLEELVEPPALAVTRFEARPLWRVEAYYIDLPDPAAAAATLAAILGYAPQLALVEVPDDNWVAISQAALPPVTAGRFTIHGSHDRHRIPQGPWSIEIDAGEAFGTAHHATTLGCLTAIDRLARRRRCGRVLDLGCGSGVLAIAAARAWPSANITASDIDPEATRVARANARANRTAGITIATADGLPRGPRGRYDLIIANILASPLIALSPRIAAALEPGGALMLSGLLTEQAPAVRATYRAHGLAQVREIRIAGWSTLVLHRR